MRCSLTLMLIMPIIACTQPGGDPAAAAEDPFVRHVAALGRKLPKGVFHLVVQRPFVVIGDEAPATVRRRAQGTVQWAVDQLKKAYFDRDPAEIIDIYLFSGEAAYRRYAKELFGDEPDTPFGYYSETNQALVMNIATGGGTLVHEIVHPFVHANFPACPAWFNEGLGSLYEQCGERDGRIVGFTNWRLAGLQRAIRAGDLPSFADMMTGGDHAFYERDPGTNYAQARYLCYYLQEKGLLRTFYRRFHAARDEDPHGLATLRAVLDRNNLKTFQKDWEKWVLTLRFP